MVKLVFAIRDIKIEAYGTPFVTQDEISAVRSVTGAMMGHEGLITQFPSDFELFQLGTYDDTKGKFDNLNAPKFIISCHSIQMNLLKSSQLKTMLEENKKEGVPGVRPAPVPPDAETKQNEVPKAKN